MISLGCHVGGPEYSPVSELVMEAVSLVARICGKGVLDSGRPAVNIIFYVSGSLSQFYNHTAIEAGRFSRKRNFVIVGVPVPREQIESGGSVAYVVAALRESVQVAAAVFAKKGTESFDLKGAMAVVDKVEEEMMKARNH